MSKTAYEILLEKLKNGQISQEEFSRQARRQDRWEIIRFFGIFFGGMLLLCVFFNETSLGRALGRALDALFENILYLAGALILGFCVIVGVLSVVLDAVRWLRGKQDNRDV